MANKADHRCGNVLIGRLTPGRTQVRFAEAGLIKLEPQFAELSTGQVARALGDDQQRRDLVRVLGNEATE